MDYSIGMPLTATGILIQSLTFYEIRIDHPKLSIMNLSILDLSPIKTPQTKIFLNCSGLKPKKIIKNWAETQPQTPQEALTIQNTFKSGK